MSRPLKPLFFRPLTQAMAHVSQDRTEVADSLPRLRGLVRQHLDVGALAIPLLPDVAVRVVSTGTARAANASLLTDIIAADPTLSMYVLRIVASPAKRPAKPILSLQHAVAWLGIDEVANIAFTLALQGKLLHVKGQHKRARRLWRHSLASALWARQLAHQLARETGASYLCGLLHNIGKVVTLGVISDVVAHEHVELSNEGYELLIEEFYRDVGNSVMNAWSLPPPLPEVLAHWENYAEAGELECQANVVNLAHKLADFTLHESCMMKRDELVADDAYRDLGLTRKDADALFDLSRPLTDELNRYLSP